MTIICELLDLDEFFTGDLFLRLAQKIGSQVSGMIIPCVPYCSYT